MTIDIRATLNRDEADIQVVNEAYSGMRYFKPLSDSALEWMEENLSGETSFLNGELVVESRYADDLMEGLATDGMVFYVPQWMDNPPAMCDGCHEPIEGEALDRPIATCRLASWCVSQVCDSCVRELRSAGLKVARRAYQEESAAERPDPARSDLIGDRAAFKAWTDGERGNMCGRFGLFAELDELAEQFNFDPYIMRDIYSPRWNIPPTVSVLAVQPPSSEGQSGRNTARLMHWGMTGVRNPRAKGSGRPLFNARAETVHRLPSFRQPFRERRCLVPASGFYEWKKDESGNRTPIWFHREDDAAVAFAGIWSAERAEDGDIDACSVITCAANELVAPVHQRMPVVLPPEAYDDWLNPDTDGGALLALLQPGEWPDMSRHPVSTEVNRAVNDYPALVERAAREMQFVLAGASDC